MPNLLPRSEDDPEFIGVSQGVAFEEAEVIASREEEFSREGVEGAEKEEDRGGAVCCCSGVDCTRCASISTLTLEVDSWTLKFGGGRSCC